MRDGLTLPLLVENRDGDTITALLTNTKGFKKSIENSELWVVNAETARLLPWEGDGQFVSIQEEEGFFKAVIDVKAQYKTESVKLDIDTTDSKNTPAILTHLYNVIHQRKIEMPEGSYTTHLFEKGLEKIKKKTGEEAIELILADDRDEIVYEAADLIYHMMVLLEEHGIKIDEVLNELSRREG